MTIYLVRFFVQIYIYNAQLSAFYRSREDGLVCPSVPSNFEQATKMFLPLIAFKVPNFVRADPILKGTTGLLSSAQNLIGIENAPVKLSKVKK